METDFAELNSHLAQFGQQHLLAFWDQLNDSSRASLAQQILAIDLDQIRTTLDASAAGNDWAAIAEASFPPPAVRLNAIAEADTTSARNAGEAAIREGKIAVVLVAGGQGSRLGFDHPKGMYPIGPVSNRTLFEMHIDRLQAIGARFNVKIPLYLMTSPATHDETIEYFKKHDRLGLAEDQITIFCQGTMPAVDASSGQLLLAAPDQLFLSPDGHGVHWPRLPGMAASIKWTARASSTCSIFR